MSTRCQVFVEGSDVVVYRHCDGYPDGKHGVLHVLLPLVKRFMAVRGDDPSYLTAQIVAKFVADNHKDCDKHNRKKKKENPDYVPDDMFRFIGFGVEAWDNGNGLHGDIEYLYVVKKDCVKVLTPGDKYGLENMAVLRYVDFDGKDVEKKARR